MSTTANDTSVGISMWGFQEDGAIRRGTQVTTLHERLHEVSMTVSCTADVWIRAATISVHRELIGIQ
jgi:hypothetical protein